MKTGPNFVLLCWLTVSVSACGWEETRVPRSVAHADDATHQAYVMEIFDEQRDFRYENGRHMKNRRHQVYVVNPDGTGTTAVTAVREFAPAPELYYMKTAGYFLLEVLEEHEDWYRNRIDIVDLNGSVRATRLIEEDITFGCTGHKTVPSPDGSIIALVLRSANPAAPNSNGCANSLVNVQFLDPSDLSVTSSFSWASAGDWSAVVTWTSEGEFIVRTGQSTDTIVHVDVDSGPEPSDYDRCYYPKTSSSWISSTGNRIRIGDKDDPVHDIGAGNLVPFGECTDGL